ncbi:MAG: phasin family protein [Chloroflexota bacterium]
MTVFDLIRNTLMAGFGVQERIREFIDDLVKKGELSESQGAKLVKEWMDLADRSKTELSKTVSDLMAKGLETMQVATSADVEGIETKLQELSSRLKRLEDERKATGG